MRQKLSDVRWVSLILFGVVLLSYGIFIRWFGLYGDDWIYLWNFHQFGAGNFVQFVAVEPAVFCLDLYPGFHAVWRACLAVSCFIGCPKMAQRGFGVWWILRIVWPDKTHQALWAALLFAVYPGFRQQPIAIQFILHFGVLDLFLFSIATMLLSAKHKQKYWTLTIASIVSALAIFSLEYFAGLGTPSPYFPVAGIG